MRLVLLALGLLLPGCAVAGDRLVTHTFVLPVGKNAEVHSAKVCFLYHGRAGVVELKPCDQPDVWRGETVLIEGVLLVLIPPISLFYVPDADPLPAFQLAIESGGRAPALRNVVTAEIPYQADRRGVTYQCPEVGLNP